MTTTIPKETRKHKGKAPGDRTTKKQRQRRRKILNERKRRIADRILNRPGPERDRPMMTASNIHYELADRVQGLAAGGIGALLLLARKTRPVWLGLNCPKSNPIRDIGRSTVMSGDETQTKNSAIACRTQLPRGRQTRAIGDPVI